MRGMQAAREAPARAVKGAKRRREPLTARFNRYPGWPFGSSGRMDPTTHSWSEGPA